MISLLLPTPGDPLILEMWISNFKKYEHLIDECLICINHLVSDYEISEKTTSELNLFYESFKSDKIKIFYNHYINSHGLILKFLYESLLFLNFIIYNVVLNYRLIIYKL